MTTLFHTPISVGAPVNASTVNAPLSQLDSAINTANGNITTVTTGLADLIAGTTGFTQLNLGATTNLTIAGGLITVTRTRHRVDTEGGASTDDLTSILGGANGDVLRLQIVSGSRLVTVVSGVGNILLLHGIDYKFTSVIEYLELMYDSTIGQWIQQPNTPVVRGIIASSADTFPASPFRLPQQLIRTTGGFTGTNSPVLSIMGRPDKRMFVMEKAAAATFEALGMAAGTSAGAGALTNSNQTDSTYINQAIGAVAGTFGGRRSTTFNLLRPSYDPYLAVLLRTSTDISNMRFWIGLCEAQVTNVDALLINTSFVGFRYSTVAADPAWMAVTNDGTPAQTVLTTNVGAAINTVYLLEAYYDSVNNIAYFSVNGSTPVSINSTLPPSTDNWGWTASGITTTASAKNILISRVYVDFN